MFSFLGQREKFSFVFATCKVEVRVSKKIGVKSKPKNYGIPKIFRKTDTLNKKTKRTRKICCFAQNKEYGPFCVMTKTKEEFISVETNGSQKVGGMIIDREKVYGLYLNKGFEGVITHEKTKFEKTTGIYGLHIPIISTTKTEYHEGKRHGICARDGVKRTRYLNDVLQ
ncbi:hypothetical protein PMV_006 [Port-miou virus]|uniref:Uncharacterized protein n=1 Tax=Port-miou virus TaxID=1733873 RepID=A0A0N7G2C0_9VIRU|nr:hypothetical protein PMV_006 [Port-miou virus]